MVSVGVVQQIDYILLFDTDTDTASFIIDRPDATKMVNASMEVPSNLEQNLATATCL